MTVGDKVTIGNGRTVYDVIAVNVNPLGAVKIKSAKQERIEMPKNLRVVPDDVHAQEIGRFSKRVTKKRAAQLNREITEALQGRPAQDHATKKSAGYYVGAELRDELIREIDSLGWEGEDTDGVSFVDRAQKVKTALQSATAHRKGYLFDVDGWSWQDYDFLKTILVDGVAEDMGNTATSRGISLGGTLIGRQIRALREKL